jgi:hypothetical protein
MFVRYISLLLWSPVSANTDSHALQNQVNQYETYNITWGGANLSSVDVYLKSVLNIYPFPTIGAC